MVFRIVTSVLKQLHLFLIKGFKLFSLKRCSIIDIGTPSLFLASPALSLIGETENFHKKERTITCIWLKSFHLVRLNGTLSGLRQFLATESALKMMKNDFYSPKKFFLFWRYLNFCSDIFVHVRKWLDKKVSLISKL